MKRLLQHIQIVLLLLAYSHAAIQYSVHRVNSGNSQSETAALLKVTQLTLQFNHTPGNEQDISTWLGLRVVVSKILPALHVRQFVKQLQEFSQHVFIQYQCKSATFLLSLPPAKLVYPFHHFF